MLSLEEERGDGAQRNAAAWHAAELIIDVMASLSPRSWPLGLLGAIVLVVPLAYVLYPVRSVVEGVGTIEPMFEDLILITSDVSGIVTRLRVERHQDVDRDAPLFEYIPDGQWAVQGYATMSRPSGAPAEPLPAEPEWYREGNKRRVVRAEALRRWSKPFYSSAQRPLAWERLLQQRLSAKVYREDDLAMEEARAAENVRLGRQDFNLVQVFDRGAGMYRATEDGEPFPSAVAGLVYSLWITQRSQFSGAAPLGEIMRPETPLEVFGLVPIPPAALRELPGWRASLAAPGEGTPAPLLVSAIEFGRVPIDAGDAKIILPNLPVTRDSVFVRLRLDPAPARDTLGRTFLIKLTSPARPRLWLWISGG